MKRKILSLLLCLSIILAFVPTALAIEVSEPSNVEQLSDTECKCAYSSPSYSMTTQTLTVSFACSDEQIQNNISNGKIVFLAASYSDNRLINAVFGTYSNGTVTFNIPNAYSYKMFALNKETFVPVSAKFEWTYENGLVVASAGNVELPTESDNLSAATSDAVYDVMYAGALLTELENLDISEVCGDKEKLEEYKQKVANAQAAYQCVLRSSAVLSAVADKEIKDNEAKLSSLQSSNDISLFASNDDDAVKWAEQINAMYDSIESGGKIKGLAQQLGVDAKRAYAMLTMANNILQGEYAEEEAANADKWVKVFTGIKTGAKVGLYISSTIATAGAAGGYVTYLEAGSILVGGVDCVVDVGKTASTICFGEDNKATQSFDKISKVTGTAGYLFGLVSFRGGSVGEKLAFIGDTVELAGGYDKLADVIYNADTDKIMATMTLVGTPFTQLSDTQKEILGLPKQDEEITVDELKTETQEKASTDEGLKDTLIDSGIATEETADAVLEETVDNFIDNATADSSAKYYCTRTYIHALKKEIISKEWFFDEDGKTICEKQYNTYSDAEVSDIGKLISVKDTTYDDDGTAWSFERRYDSSKGYLESERMTVLYSGTSVWREVTNTTYNEYGEVKSYSTTTEIADGCYEKETSSYRQSVDEALYLYSYIVERKGGHGEHSFGDKYREVYYYPNGDVSRSVVYNLYDEQDLPYKHSSEVVFNEEGEVCYVRHYNDNSTWTIKNGEEFCYYTQYLASAYGVPYEALKDVGGLYYHHIFVNGITVSGSYNNVWVQEQKNGDDIIPAHWETEEYVGYGN